MTGPYITTWESLQLKIGDLISIQDGFPTYKKERTICLIIGKEQGKTDCEIKVWPLNQELLFNHFSASCPLADTIKLIARG